MFIGKLITCQNNKSKFEMCKKMKLNPNVPKKKKGSFDFVDKSDM